LGHEQLRIIDNSTDFKGKIARASESVFALVGVPIATGSRRIFITSPLSETDLRRGGGENMHVEEFDVEQTYLAPWENEEGGASGYQFVRKRSQSDAISYTYLKRKTIEDEEGKEQELMSSRSISGREYLSLLKQADPERSTIRKKVLTFHYSKTQYTTSYQHFILSSDQTYYELEFYKEPDELGHISRLVCELPSGSPLSLPPFLASHIKKEVTGQQHFSSYSIAGAFGGEEEEKKESVLEQFNLD